METKKHVRLYNQYSQRDNYFLSSDNFMYINNQGHYFKVAEEQAELFAKAPSVITEKLINRYKMGSR